MRILVVKNWKKVALERDEWAKLLKKAGPTRAVEPMMMMMMMMIYFKRDIIFFTCFTTTSYLITDLNTI
jgi:hypothetical protein